MSNKVFTVTATGMGPERMSELVTEVLQGENTVTGLAWKQEPSGLAYKVVVTYTMATEGETDWMDHLYQDDE